MASTPSTAATTPSCSQPPSVTDEKKSKGKGKGQKTKIKKTDEETYDFSRKEGRVHTPAPYGRGSPSGRNGWAMWMTCSQCMLRLEYIPAFGAHARYRSAGPLSEDTKVQLEEKANEIKENPDVLKTANVALDGAGRSMLRRSMETIRSQKEALKKKGKEESTQAVKTTTTTAKKASKRSGAQGAEELEAEGSDASWSEANQD